MAQEHKELSDIEMNLKKFNSYLVGMFKIASLKDIRKPEFIKKQPEKIIAHERINSDYINKSLSHMTSQSSPASKEEIARMRKLFMEKIKLGLSFFVDQQYESALNEFDIADKSQNI